MPDWITHITLGSAVFKITQRSRSSLLLFMIASVLPDFLKVVSVKILDFSLLPHYLKEFTVWYFEPFHTPFIAIFYSLILALIIEGDIKKNFIIIYSGCLFHFFLDSFQYHLSFYQLLGYPFSFANLNFQVVHASHPIFFIMPLILFPVLIYLAVTSKYRLRIRLRYKGLIIILLIFIFSFPFFTREMFYKNNYNSLDFLNNPTRWENRYVELGVSPIIVINREIFIIEELERRIKVVVPVKEREKYKEGDFISVKGRYYNSKLYAQKIFPEPIVRKKFISLIGLIALVIVIMRSYKFKS